MILTYRQPYSSKRNRPNLIFTQRIRIAHAKAWAFLLCVYVLGRTSLTDEKCPTPIVFTNFCFGAFGKYTSLVFQIMNKSTTNDDNAKGCAVFGVILSLLALFLIIKCSCSDHIDNQEPEMTAEEKEADIKAEVIVAAQMEVEDNLKSPSTAEFPWGIEPRKINDSTYAVVSYVDSQNGFGAMVRSNFMVEVIINRQTKNTKSKLLMFNQRE